MSSVDKGSGGFLGKDLAIAFLGVLHVIAFCILWHSTNAAAFLGELGLIAATVIYFFIGKPLASMAPEGTAPGVDRFPDLTKTIEVGVSLPAVRYRKEAAPLASAVGQEVDGA